MDEFEKIKAFSESLAERQQKMSEASPSTDSDLNLPQYLSQFRATPAPEEKESKRLLWIVLFLCAVIAVLVVIALVKRLPEMEETEIVVIAPTPTPVKVLPENPGGLNIPDKDKVVYNRVAEATPTPVVESLFPEIEQPMMPSEVIEPETKEDVIIAAPVEETPEQTVAENAAEPLPELNIDLLNEETPLETETTQVEAPAVPVPQVKPFDVQESSKSEPAKKDTKTTNGPVWKAQLLSSASKAKVESSWKTISKQQAALLSDMPYQIISATIPGKGTFWRLQVGEFSTKEMVMNLCAKLKQKKQECIPVK
ncbi:MAG: SPOR domain-containing protein [Alphaproteobacteria bacterium]|nr:SPOR domain-containing protein [Alphaproteobacteria bacterium]